MHNTKVSKERSIWTTWTFNTKSLKCSKHVAKRGKIEAAEQETGGTDDLNQLHTASIC